MGRGRSQTESARLASVQLAAPSVSSMPPRKFVRVGVGFVGCDDCADGEAGAGGEADDDTKPKWELKLPREVRKASLTAKLNAQVKSPASGAGERVGFQVNVEQDGESQGCSELVERDNCPVCSRQGVTGERPELDAGAYRSVITRSLESGSHRRATCGCSLRRCCRRAAATLLPG